MLQATTISETHKKGKLPLVRSGDSVKVHHLIREGAKSRIQIFEGVVIKVTRQNEINATITVRRIASGVGVEKTFPLHAPNVQKVEIVRRSKVRRNFLSYLRARQGKSARLANRLFDKAAVNVADEVGTADTANDSLDEAITELDPDTLSDTKSDNEEPLTSVTEAETKAAKADQMDQDQSVNEDEAQMPAEEVQDGLDQADQSTK